MTSLANIRTALAETIESYVLDELYIYQNVPDVLQFPALIIRPDSADFAGAMSHGDDMWKFDLYVVVGKADSADAAEKLDEFVTSGGLSAIRSAIDDNYTLGLTDTTVFVRGVKNYGGGFETARTRHIGAILKIEIHTDGSQV